MIEVNVNDFEETSREPFNKPTAIRNYKTNLLKNRLVAAVA